MKGFRLLSICLLAVILFTSWGPAAVIAAPPESVQATSVATLTINNKTGVDVTVKLAGARSYEFIVHAGKWPFDVEKGKYKVAYTACGKKFKGTLNLDAGKSKMTIAACPSSKLIILNIHNANATLVLTGPARYTFTLLPGINRFKVIKGTYQYTIYICGTTEKGTLYLKTAGRYIVRCPQ